MDMSQYMEIFIEESKEHLQSMNSIMLELEKDSSDMNMLNEIFRIAHTIKGMSGTMGYTKIANLTHEMENVLHLVRNKELEVNGAIIDILFECFDTLEGFISSLEATGEENNVNAEPLAEKLAVVAKTKSTDSLEAKGTSEPKKAEEPKEEKVAEKPVAEVKVADASQCSTADTGNMARFNLEVDGTYLSTVKYAISQGINAHMIRIDVDAGCMLKAARSFIVFNTLEQFGEIIKSFPVAEEIEDEKFDDFFEVLYLTRLDDITVKNELLKISELTNIDVMSINFENIGLLEEIECKTSDSGRLKTADDEEIEKEEASKVEAAPEADVVQEHKETTPPVTAQSSAEKAPQVKGEEKAAKSTSSDKQKTSKTVRVDIDRLDSLMNLVSELIIIKTRLEDNVHISKGTNNSEAIEYLERITTSLHDAVMKVRMVPVERTFNRFPRMVRDLAKDLGKGINLVMSGEETEVDRTVIDEIGDPLIHLIRNSIDHGIENPEARKAKGKPDAGTVNLRAYPDGNTVVIEVEDDGNGINTERVLEKALSKGVIQEHEAEIMSVHEINNLIFRPGFSTAEVITDLSGRGVGLDVVRTKIESLNGTVEVKSVMGKGSKFTIRLPLTLAIIQALMVNLGDEKYALPLNSIKEITTISSSSITMIQNQEAVLYRNTTLPLIRLGDILHVKPVGEERSNLVVVVVKKGDIEAGIIVDKLIGQQEIVIKSLGRYLTGVKVIAGATILGNGGVALIVDPNQLI